jgi:nitrogen regulatory protein PII
MLDFYKKHEMEDVEMEDIKQHLIITITNEGYAEKVMSEAKKAGATGGTTINGRGLNNKTAIKFLKIDIEPEKDIVLILATSESKNKIMESIISSCGIKTPGGGICFSLPVDYVVGLNKELIN